MIFLKKSFFNFPLTISLLRGNNKRVPKGFRFSVNVIIEFCLNEI